MFCICHVFLYLKVFLGKWDGYDVAISTLTAAFYTEDFLHGLKMLTILQPNALVTQLVGFCIERNRFVTEYHRHKSADSLMTLLSTMNHVKNFSAPSLKFRLCLNYVDILALLHGGSAAGVRVMCDSNDLDKLLQQFLVTADLHLVLNDLDALPEITNTSRIKCGHREIISDFAAPEQLWPFDDDDFDDAYMPAYDEKTDIWKIPDVCLHFLSNCSECLFVRNWLFKIHNRCKEHDPEKRPSVLQVREEYENVWKRSGF